MKLKQLFTDDSAVSPVIGVILMVAITVILAAVIGTFVLNLGGSVSQTTPQASFGFDYNTSNGNVTITHESGSSIESDRLTTKGFSVTGQDWNETYSDQSVSAGDSVNLQNSDGWSGETVRVVWSSENNENSATLSESTAPSN
ncbi:type IV pilin N-terminal domain-containing protein [Halogeometricum sp. S1BR25-6]|uniref:Type IV pilin N-terminal domain-containing protein n=1 Tax=Halogeometricum salsisoli TaxID=2950536 RepID=A0ABU2GF84_9EURY|nr:type IV pilin N-terminal domain-containing protein [Halogeometricum sp. S1BR25-6]MDS0299442.1 type IV pilin N-terminal domain-containing protein [Halogeometricum sp. S1BR25-6]